MALRSTLCSAVDENCGWDRRERIVEFYPGGVKIITCRHLFSTSPTGSCLGPNVFDGSQTIFLMPACFKFSWVRGTRPKKDESCVDEFPQQQRCCFFLIAEFPQRSCTLIQTSGTTCAQSDRPEPTPIMEVSVLRKDGRVVLLETNNDVVDALTSVLHAPVGAVAGLTDESAFSAMQSSVVKLRDGVFVKKPKVAETLDVEGMVSGRMSGKEGGGLRA